MRRVYMAGKALELAATVVDRIVNEKARRIRLSPRTIEQVRAAHDLLLEASRDPPTLGELARSTGRNVSKLTAGFRQIYGASVFDYLQGIVSSRPMNSFATVPAASPKPPIRSGTIRPISPASSASVSASCPALCDSFRLHFRLETFETRPKEKRRRAKLNPIALSPALAEKAREQMRRRKNDQIQR